MAEIIDLRAAKRRMEEQNQAETDQEFIRRRLAAVSAFERAASWRVESVSTQHSPASGAGFFVKQFFITVAGLAMLFLVANAGSLQPSAAPASTMHSLLELTSRTDSPDNFNRYNYSLEGLGNILGTPTTTATQIATTSATIASSINGVYTRLNVPPFGGANATTSYTCASGTCDLNLNQLYQFTDFTVSSGATLAPSTAAPGGLYVLVSGTCTIAGTITVSAKGNAAGVSTAGGGNGG
ncbi:hypothetical protein KGQ34_03260, partial [Patescibacteria group bacterium]|nr:hypothetical protein [Patescibacteria group bacterium]